MSLGKKLRQARMEASLSQRALCGSVITRNMLSQIENGAANPSMSTLQYLAGQLGKPVSFFLEEIPASVPIPPIPEAVSQLEKARHLTDAGKIPEAQALLRSIDTTDMPDWIRRQWILLLQDPAQAGSLPSLDGELLLRAQSVLAEKDAEKCLSLLAPVDEKTAQWQLLMGEALLLQHSYSQAAAHFHCAEESYPHRCAAALEICYRELEDFQKAYFYACKVRSLTGK